MPAWWFIFRPIRCNLLIINKKKEIEEQKNKFLVVRPSLAEGFWKPKFWAILGPQNRTRYFQITTLPWPELLRLFPTASCDKYTTAVAGGRHAACGMRKRLRQRHETINRRLKCFKVLKTTFRHYKKEGIKKHSLCFRGAAIMLQLAFETGQQELFDMREYDDRISDREATMIYGV